MNRRGLLLGLGAALAVPAIVKAESLMKIAVLRETFQMSEIYLLQNGGGYLDLDDYEEGTWTPAFTCGNSGITHSTSTGNYVRIGKMVHVTARLEVPHGAVISGLPFYSLPRSGLTNP